MVAGGSSESEEYEKWKRLAREKQQEKQESKVVSQQVRFVERPDSLELTVPQIVAEEANLTLTCFRCHRDSGAEVYDEELLLKRFEGLENLSVGLGRDYRTMDKDQMRQYLRELGQVVLPVARELCPEVVEEIKEKNANLRQGYI